MFITTTMNKIYYVTGPMYSLSLPDAMKAALNKIMQSGDKVITSDWRGTDYGVQLHLYSNHYTKLSVYTHQSIPYMRVSASTNFHRANVKWAWLDKLIQVSCEMINDADAVVVLWSNTSKAIYNTIVRALELGREVFVYKQDSNEWLKSKQDIQKLLQNSGALFI